MTPFPRLESAAPGRWLRLAIAIAAAGLAVAAPVAAQDSPAVMESSRARVTLADFEAELAKLPAAQQQAFVGSRVRVVQILNNLYLNRILAAEARALGLDQDPVLARQIEQQVEKMLAQARLDRLDKETRASLPGRAEQIEARAKEVYAANPAKFQTPEQVHVAHVLVKAGADGDEAAKARAEAIRARAAAGADFAALARETSDDPTAKRNGGDLGMIAVDRLDPAFVAAALALSKPGELSPVVKSSYGYHVILFKAKRPATTRSYDEAKAALVGEIGDTIVGDTRTLHMSLPFQPEPKIDEALLGQIMQGAQTVPADRLKGAPPKR